MAYVNAQSPNRRIAILGTVATIHLVAGYALVTGLATSFVPVIETIITGRNDPLPPPDPRPSPKPRDHHSDPKVRPVDNPLPAPIPPIPLPPTGTELTGGDDFTGEGLGNGTFPAPLPSPEPPTFNPTKPKPRGNQSLWVTDNDYPTNDIRLEHEGLTRVRLTVGTNGRVTQCEVTGSSGWPGLDAAACDKLTSRARFDPAIDHTGARVEGSFATSVRWRLPEE